MKEWKGFKRGIDLGGWLSQCDYSADRLDNFITESDIEKIASWGLDHVRLPVDYNVLDMPEDKGFEYIDNAISWSRKNGLNIIIDLHKTRGFSFDAGENQHGFFESGELQKYFYTLWERIASQYGNDPEHIAFELLNEVTEERFIGEWNRISNECIRRIRAIAPDTVILVGSYYNNSVTTVSALDKPYDDKIVYNFHCYDPLEFTHQGAYWTDMIDREKRMAFEESCVSREYYMELFRDAVEAAKKNDTVLYCGEYGVIDIVSPDDTVKWYRVIHSVFEELNIGRSAWSYKEMDFGISDKRMDGVRDELVKLL